MSDSYRQRFPAAAWPVHISYHPLPGLGWLSVKNALLTIITLGIYSFWGKTLVRKHIWSSVVINGDPLEYTGTGGELFKGFLIVAFLILFPLYAANFAAQLLLLQSPLLGSILLAILAFTAIFLIGAGTYYARRYRASRTVWRGIRGAITGSPWKYAVKYFLSFLALILTLGWSHPALKTKLTGILTRETSFGSKAFAFEGSAKPLYKTFALCWVGLIVLIACLFGVAFWLTSQGYVGEDTGTMFGVGAVAAIYILFPIVVAFYIARQMNLHTAYTSFQGLGFDLNATAGSLIWLVLSNLFIVLFTLGIASPFAMQRSVKYFIDRLEVSGQTDIQAIVQSQQALDKRGEGLAGAFDIDGF